MQKLQLYASIPTILLTMLVSGKPTSVRSSATLTSISTASTSEAAIPFAPSSINTAVLLQLASSIEAQQEAQDATTTISIPYSAFTESPTAIWESLSLSASPSSTADEVMSPNIWKTLQGPASLNSEVFHCIRVSKSSADQVTGKLSTAQNNTEVLQAIAPKGTSKYNGTDSQVSIEWVTNNEGTCFCMEKDNGVHGICCDDKAEFPYADMDSPFQWDPLNFLSSGGPGFEAGVYC